MSRYVLPENYTLFSNLQVCGINGTSRKDITGTKMELDMVIVNRHMHGECVLEVKSYEDHAPIGIHNDLHKYERFLSCAAGSSVIFGNTGKVKSYPTPQSDDAPLQLDLGSPSALHDFVRLGSRPPPHDFVRLLPPKHDVAIIGLQELGGPQEPRPPLPVLLRDPGDWRAFQASAHVNNEFAFRFSTHLERVYILDTPLQVRNNRNHLTIFGLECLIAR